MMKKALSMFLIGIMVFAAFMSLPITASAEATEQAATASVDWSGIYYRYITENSDSVPFGSDSTFEINDNTPLSLYDYDKDGVPELLIGYIGARGRTAWSVFTLNGTTVNYAGGNAGKETFYSLDERFPGIFRTDSINDKTYLFYSELVNGTLVSRDVRYGVYNQSTKQYDYTVYDNELYNAYLGCTTASGSSGGVEYRVANNYMESVEWQKIRADGWDSFVARYGYSTVNDDWSDMYHSHIMNHILGHGNVIKVGSGMGFSLQDDTRLALHDYDMDGVPELIFTTDSSGAGDLVMSAYMIYNGKITYIGGGMGGSSVFYSDNSAYHGIFSDRRGQITYAGLSDGDAPARLVAKYSYNSGTGKYTYTISDEKIYNVFLECTTSDSSNYRIPKNTLKTYSWKEIRTDGWDSFVARYGYQSGTIFTVLGEKFTRDLSYYAESWDSTQYNPELAHLMMTFANAAYSQEDVERGYEELGLSNYEAYNYEKTFFDYYIENTCYNFGSVLDKDGTICVLIAVRGSGSLFDISQGTMDWLGNLDILSLSETNYSTHKDFYMNAQFIYYKLNDYLYRHFNKHTTNMRNVKYFITGHSRGAAVANLLEFKLGPDIGKQNIFGYNFAVPNNVIVNKNESMEFASENVFNISNVRDIVSFSPGFETDYIFSFMQWWESGKIDNIWQKRGVSAWFDDGGFMIDVGAHDPKRYLSFLRAHKGIETFTKYKFDYELEGWGPFVRPEYKVYIVCCPVDVEMIDESGSIIASVADGSTDYHGSHFGDAIVTTIDDHKMIAVPADKHCTLRMVGSDTGTLDYYVALTDARTEKVTALKSFEDVSLQKGKEMLGKAVNVRDRETDMIRQEEKLLLVDDRENGTEILSDGTEMDCATCYLLGDADNNRSIDVSDATLIQREAAKINVPFTDEILKQGDSDGSGELEISDATYIQYYLAQIATPYLIGVEVYDAPLLPAEDTIRPYITVSCKAETSASQKITLKMTDNVKVKRYGMYRDPYGELNGASGYMKFVDVDTDTVTVTVDQPGRYFFVAEDSSGNRSIEKSIDIMQYMLEPNGGSTSVSTALSGKNSFLLPIPVRSGFRFIGWSTQKPADYTGSATSSDFYYSEFEPKYLYANWLPSESPAESIKPTVSIEYDEQKYSRIMLYMSDSSGILGYYWGTDPDYRKNLFVPSSKTSAEGSPSNPGTYYLNAVDIYGNVSETASIDYDEVILNANGGFYSQRVSLNGTAPLMRDFAATSFCRARGREGFISAPQRSGYVFEGWAERPNAVNGEKTIITSGSKTYYAVWKKDPDSSKKLYYSFSGGDSWGYDGYGSGGLGIVRISCYYSVSKKQYDFEITGVSKGSADVTLYYKEDVFGDYTSVPVKVYVDDDLTVHTL